MISLMHVHQCQILVLKTKLADTNVSHTTSAYGGGEGGERKINESRNELSAVVRKGLDVG